MVAQLNREVSISTGQVVRLKGEVARLKSRTLMHYVTGTSNNNNVDVLLARLGENV